MFEDDEDFGPDYYEDDNEDESENGEESEEEKLSEMVEERYETSEDCKYLKRMIDDAQKANATATVDPEIQEAYADCKKALTDLDRQIQEASAALSASE